MTPSLVKLLGIDIVRRGPSWVCLHFFRKMQTLYQISNLATPYDSLHSNLVDVYMCVRVCIFYIDRSSINHRAEFFLPAFRDDVYTSFWG